MIRVISIGFDRKLFSPESSVALRTVSNASVLGELHIIVFARADLGLGEGRLGNNVFLYPTNSRNRWLYMFDAIKIGKRIISEVFFGQTVITSQDPFETGVVGTVLKQFSKLPLQIQLHTDAWSTHFQYGGFLNWIRVTLFARWVLRRADQVRVVTEKVRRDVVVHAKVNPKIVSVLPVYVGTPSSSPFQAPGPDLHVKYQEWKIIILVASRLSREKNIPLALKVFKKVHARYPDVGLVIVGSGSEEDKLKRLVARGKLAESISFEGWQDDLSSYFQSADIFLNTSLYEGYGMTILEAGRASRAVLTTEVGVAFDLLKDGHNASVCPVGDESCLFTKLITLIENPHVRQSMGAELKKTVDENTLSKEEYLKEFQAGFEALYNDHL